MLRQRILTSLVLAPLVIAALFLLSTFWLGWLFGALLLLAAWEWAALAGVHDRLLRFLYVLVVAVTGINLLPIPAVPVLAASVAWWLGEAYVLRRAAEPAGAAAAKLLNQLRGLFLLAPAWYAALYLHHSDPRAPALLLFLLLLVWLADTAAFFVGTAFGRTRLAPRISPGKTLEGALGGLGAALILALLGGIFYWRFDGLDLVLWLLLAALTAGFSVLGDLVESRAKRRAGVKDSGTLLPGHGGMMDRIDAFIAAAPVFALGWALWQGAET